MPNASISPILTVKNLTTQLVIQKQAWTLVDRLSFNLYGGQTLALVGESGCGKSLTALSLMRILPSPPALPLQGEVLYRGQNLLLLSEKHMRHLRGSKIAMIFQDPMSALNPVYTIGDQLAEVAHFHLGLYGEEALKCAEVALKSVGIDRVAERLSAYPHQLSGGLKQRVMIAMAMMCEPDILIADEPTTALDVTIQAQVLSLMRSLQKQKGTAILLITHDMGVVSEMADEVIVMYTAQGVEKGTLTDVFSHTAHPYTQGLFESRPSLETRRGQLHPIPGQVPSFMHMPSGCRFHPRCPFVMPKCVQGEVPNFNIDSSQTHWAKCWLHDGSQESQEKLLKTSWGA